MTETPLKQTDREIESDVGGHETAADRAYALIRMSLLNGEHLPGARLKEEDLAVKLGVSRTPVREALMRLAVEGMLQYVANQGVRVTVWSEDEIAEIFRLRAFLESHGAELAAKRIKQDEIDELRRLNARIADLAVRGNAEDIIQISEINIRFHKLIYLTARSTRLEKILSGLIEIPLVVRSFRDYDYDRLRLSISHHNQLIEALAAGDPEWASSVMRLHILSARRGLGPD